MHGAVRGARIALVDDVLTTGATLAEATRVLRRAGAADVECWVVARTLGPARALSGGGVTLECNVFRRPRPTRDPAQHG